MNKTTNSNRLHIAIYGRRNSGKSSLINAITGESTSVVSDVAGTTTDTVARAMELHGIGACLFIDTPGFDDEGELGAERVRRTLRTIERTDIAVLLCEDGGLDLERAWLEHFKSQEIATIPVITKIDLRGDTTQLERDIEQLMGDKPLLLSSKRGLSIEIIREAILRKLSPDDNERSITRDLVQRGDVVMLVMPQDAQAPKGRLILPQVETMRELLDKGCTVVSCSTNEIELTLKSLRNPPHLIITDSQVFDKVHSLKPANSLLTSFSILMAAHKGDIRAFVEGSKAIESLKESSRILIAEGCAHAPLAEDIGRVKIPRLLRQRVGENLRVDIVAGRNFPADLTPYDLIIHCGGCMFNRKYVMNRISQANEQGVAITNYGIAIAQLNGILDRVVF